MKWSHLRLLFKSHLTEGLRDRIDIHVTRPGSASRERPVDGWVVFEKQEVVEISLKKAARFTGEQTYVASGKGLYQILMEYRSLSIEQIMRSEDNAIRAFGMLDKRLDQHDLRLLLEENMEPLVQKFYDIRMRAEGLGARRSLMSWLMKPGLGRFHSVPETSHASTA